MSIVTRYTVSGMTCDHCVRTVTETISKLPGVEHVDIDLASGKVEVRSAAALDRSDLAHALDEAGYELAHP